MSIIFRTSFSKFQPSNWLTTALVVQSSSPLFRHFPIDDHFLTPDWCLFINILKSIFFSSYIWQVNVPIFLSCQSTFTKQLLIFSSFWCKKKQGWLLLGTSMPFHPHFYCTINTQLMPWPYHQCECVFFRIPLYVSQLCHLLLIINLPSLTSHSCISRSLSPGCTSLYCNSLQGHREHELT